MRHILAALLVAVLTLAGVGRALAATPGRDPGLPSIAGVATPICHAGTRHPAHPSPASHDCCDQCTLGAPAVLAAETARAAVPSASHAIGRAAVMGWTLRQSRARTPRQAQGPPAA